MTEAEKYLFDLTGYIAIEDVLSEQDIALCNEAVDHHTDQIHERTGEQSLSGGSPALRGATGRGDLKPRFPISNPIDDRQDCSSTSQGSPTRTGTFHPIIVVV